MVIVDDGQQAVDAMQAPVLPATGGHPFDDLLTDMQMPVLDGYQLASMLRERGETRPIMALTAHAMAEDRTRCLESGCTAYHSKPINAARLIADTRAMVEAFRQRTHA